MRTNNRAVVVLRSGDKVLLVHRFLRGMEYYVFPGGGVESEETAEEAVIREAMEEIGVGVQKARFLFSVKHCKNADSLEVEHHFFEVSEFNGNPEWVAEGSEALTEDNVYRLEWVEIKDLSCYDIKPNSCISKLVESLSSL